MKILNLLFLAACVSPLSNDNSKESERPLNSVSKTKRGAFETYANPQDGYKEEFFKNFLSVIEIKKNKPKKVNVTTEENNAQESVCQALLPFTVIHEDNGEQGVYTGAFLPFFLKTGAIKALIDTHQNNSGFYQNILQSEIKYNLRQSLTKSKEEAFLKNKDFKSIEISDINLFLSKIKKDPNYEIPLKFFYNQGDINDMYKDFNIYIKGLKMKKFNQLVYYNKLLSTLDSIESNQIENELQLQKMIYLCQKRELRSFILKDTKR